MIVYIGIYLFPNSTVKNENMWIMFVQPHHVLLKK